MATAKKAKKANVSAEELMNHYREMLMIRRFEEKAGQLYGMGLIGGFCHLYIGQEAVVVGLEAAAKEGDQRITSYRDHGHMLACGMDPKGVMAELTGREGGYSKGKGGSMHMFSKEKNFYGGHGIVAASHSQTNTAATTMCPLPISGMVPPTKAKSTKPSTWQAFGNCLAFLSSKTTNTPWAHPCNVALPHLNFTHVVRPLASLAKPWMAWMFWPLKKQANGR